MTIVGIEVYFRRLGRASEGEGAAVVQDEVGERD
jgi:hypothetical protein